MKMSNNDPTDPNPLELTLEDCLYQIEHYVESNRQLGNEDVAWGMEKSVEFIRENCDLFD